MSIDLKTATEAPLVDGDKIWGSDSAETAVKVATDVVGKAATQTLTNKTLTAPVISSITNVGTLTLPTSTDTLVGRDTTDTLTNKTLTAPVINAGTGTSLAMTLGITSSGDEEGIGYATGAGGAVTQITSPSTAVTLNKVCGQITTVALTTAAAAEEEFTVNNSTVAATDVVIVSTTYDGGGVPLLSVKKMAAGAFNIVISNVHAANPFDAVMVINFVVIKSVAA